MGKIYVGDCNIEEEVKKQGFRFSRSSTNGSCHFPVKTDYSIGMGGEGEKGRDRLGIKWESSAPGRSNKLLIPL